MKRKCRKWHLDHDGCLKKTAFLSFPCYYDNGGFKTTAVRIRGSEGNQVPGISIAYKDLYAKIPHKFFHKKEN